MLRPRLEWLETFLAIIDNGSLTAAGAQMGRSQSAVSLQLQRLEDVVGTSLFVRDTRHVRPTAAGERLVPQARKVLAAADAALLAAHPEHRRKLLVGVPEEYAEQLIPRLLASLGVFSRPLDFEVQCAGSMELEQRLVRKGLDLALVLADEVNTPGTVVLSDPVVWLQAPGSDVSAQRPLPVVLFDQECSWRKRAIESLDKADVDYRIVFTSPSVSGVRAGIRAGIGIGALAASTAGPELERVTSGVPPDLPAAELVMLRGNVVDEDVAQVSARLRFGRPVETR